MSRLASFSDSLAIGSSRLCIDKRGPEIECTFELRACALPVKKKNKILTLIIYYNFFFYFIFKYAAKSHLRIGLFCVVRWWTIVQIQTKLLHMMRMTSLFFTTYTQIIVLEKKNEENINITKIHGNFSKRRKKCWDLHHKQYSDIEFPRDSCNYYKYKRICPGLDYATRITWTLNWISLVSKMRIHSVSLLPLWGKHLVRPLNHNW